MYSFYIHPITPIFGVSIFSDFYFLSNEVVMIDGGLLEKMEHMLFRNSSVLLIITVITRVSIGLRGLPTLMGLEILT